MGWGVGEELTKSWLTFEQESLCTNLALAISYWFLLPFQNFMTLNFWDRSRAKTCLALVLNAISVPYVGDLGLCVIGIG